MALKRPFAPTGSHVRILAQLLGEAEHRLRRELARVLEEEGSSLEEWRALARLAHGASHAMTETAEHALLPAPSLTRLIDRMVAANLAYRKVDPADRRRVLVRITARGQALDRRLSVRVDAEGERILAGTAPGEVAQLIALLATLLERG